MASRVSYFHIASTMACREHLDGTEIGSALLLGGTCLGVGISLLRIRRGQRTDKQIEASREQIEASREQMVISQKQVKESQEGNYLSKLNQGINMLYSDSDSKRLGAIEILHNLADAHKGNDKRVKEIFDAFQVFLRKVKIKTDPKDPERPESWGNPISQIKGTILGGKMTSSDKTNSKIYAQCRKNGIDLQGSDLRWTPLHRTDLRKANLGWADLRGSDLQKADLRGAVMQFAKLQGANLSEVKFSPKQDFGDNPVLYTSININGRKISLNVDLNLNYAFIDIEHKNYLCSMLQEKYHAQPDSLPIIWVEKSDPRTFQFLGMPKLPKILLHKTIDEIEKTMKKMLFNTHNPFNDPFFEAFKSEIKHIGYALNNLDIIG
ncbi:MAG: pentapeptide repeat-containing protein [Cytophagales bacterium]|nr:pentapeptide repeat-containing protein [Cytophagales bacterium]